MVSTISEPRRTTPPTLLVVDDEPGVVEAICEVLQGSSYRILCATDPKRALEILNTGSPVDLLITDLFMPDMDGPELLELGRRMRPQLPALFTTGMASDQELRRWRSKGQPIVAKPWIDAQFLDAVNRLLRVDDSKAKNHD